MTRPSCIVLAAGKGTRMKSDRAKVLHPVLGRPMIVRIVESILAVPDLDVVVVVGHQAEEVENAVSTHLPGNRIRFALQQDQRGTGHALLAGLGRVRSRCRTLLVVNGDMPLLGRASLARFLRGHEKRRASASIVTTRLPDPAGYGRVVRSPDGHIVLVREDRDCSTEESRIPEVNAGLYCFGRGFLDRNLPRLGTDNDQGEFYITDLVAMAAVSPSSRTWSLELDPVEVLGVNDRAELARIERILLDDLRSRHQRRGVTLRMPETIWMDETVRIGRDVEIGPGAVLLGGTSIGRGCRIGAGCVVRDTRLEPDAVLEPYSVTDDAVVRRGAIVGPMARLRPGTDVGRDAHVGNFVELKKTRLGRGSKANHLSYLGDGVVGRNVNIGAGTIFCNYDGFSKHPTVIEDDVFIGSDSQLVAPVTVGRGSYVGSGSTITSDVPPDSLAMARSRQVNKPGRAGLLRELLRNARHRARRG